MHQIKNKTIGEVRNSIVTQSLNLNFGTFNHSNIPTPMGSSTKFDSTFSNMRTRQEGMRQSQPNFFGDMMSVQNRTSHNFYQKNLLTLQDDTTFLTTNTKPTGPTVPTVESREEIKIVNPRSASNSNMGQIPNKILNKAIQARFLQINSPKSTKFTRNKKKNVRSVRVSPQQQDQLSLSIESQSIMPPIVHKGIKIKRSRNKPLHDELDQILVPRLTTSFIERIRK